jgi:uncharacterized protein (DUF169 family)
MPLPSSSQISMNDVNVEIRKPSTNQVDLNNADVRLTFEVPSGEISLQDGYGKCFCTSYNITRDENGIVDFEALNCNEARSYLGVFDQNEFEPGGFYGNVCIVKGSLNTDQSLLNYSDQGCC